MYVTKRPTLRINQSDLKCRNGCGYYGNAEWDGYCSKCYREYIRKRREEQAPDGNLDGNRSHVSGFSKFEEKKRQQTDKKNKYLKNLTPVFRKTSSARESVRSERHQPRHANPEIEKLLAEYISSFGVWGEDVRKDFLKCSNSVYTKVRSEIDCKPIEEVADLVQRYYTMYSNRLQSEQVYKNVSVEAKDQIFDFFEKFVMVHLYSVLFCPHTTADEEKDLVIQERIRKLSWVNAYHLGCCISETSLEVRELVYTSITELLGIDSVKAPQEKLTCVVKCCRSIMEVLQHCQGGPVSADEFLPALIFIVLKANPARLKSNMNFVTRFCNAQRLMQGEGGYYFTNVCCAVSFIESLTAESLSMPENEFKAYMMGAITPVSAWESALVACESMHQLCEHLTQLKNLSDRIDVVKGGTDTFRSDVEKFRTEITKKVTVALDKYPLVIKPPQKLYVWSKEGLFRNKGESPPKLTIEKEEYKSPERSDASNFYWKNIQMQSFDGGLTKVKSDGKINLTLALESPLKDLSNIGNTSGLSNVSYDIDLSDLSNDNSLAEALTPEKSNSTYKSAPFTPDEKFSLGSPHPDFTSSGGNVNDDLDLNTSVIDKIGDTPTSNLPSPLKPTTSYVAVSSKQGWQIPNIPCSTGEFNSLMLTESNMKQNHADN